MIDHPCTVADQAEADDRDDRAKEFPLHITITPRSSYTLRSGSAVVPILLDPMCDGSGATGPPSVSCSVERDVFLIDLVNQVFFQPRIPMTCDAIAESEASWEARRAGTISQLLDEDVEILFAPEPGGGLPIAAGAATVLALSRRRRGRF